MLQKLRMQSTFAWLLIFGFLLFPFVVAMYDAMYDGGHLPCKRIRTSTTSMHCDSENCPLPYKVQRQRSLSLTLVHFGYS